MNRRKAVRNSIAWVTATVAVTAGADVLSDDVTIYGPIAAGASEAWAQYGNGSDLQVEGGVAQGDPAPTAADMPTLPPALDPGAAGPKVPRSEAVFSLSCQYSHSSQNDPIVFPGQENAAHLHDFFGNASTSFDTTTDSLVASKTSCENSADRSAYWVPALFDGSSRQIEPTSILVYYEYGDNMDNTPLVEAFPLGFRMIAGSANNTEPLDLTKMGWQCVTPGPPSDDKIKGPESSQILACPKGQNLTAYINFPSCWDGLWLNSLDPKAQDHVVYPDAEGFDCPSTHSYKLPMVHARLIYSGFRGVLDAYLASDVMTDAGKANRGQSLHGDFWNAWVPGALKELVAGCLNDGDGCNTGEKVPDGLAPEPFPTGVEHAPYQAPMSTPMPGMTH